MPYIEEKNRILYNDYINAFELMHAANVTDGELNYLVTGILHAVLTKRGIRYSNINELIGVLECAKLELYRQLAAPYEDKKKAENGAVSSLDSGYTPEQHRALKDAE